MNVRIALVTLACSSLASGDILHVPADFPTIQEAINAAAPDSDEIIVAPGNYNEALGLLGKELILRSSDGPDATIIDTMRFRPATITDWLRSLRTRAVLKATSFPTAARNIAAGPTRSTNSSRKSSKFAPRASRKPTSAPWIISRTRRRTG